MSVQPPVITLVSPATAVCSTPTVLDVTGENLSTVSLVSFRAPGDGQVSAVVDDTHIRITTPVTTAGHSDLTLSNPGGSALYEPGFQFTLAHHEPVGAVNSGSASVAPENDASAVAAPAHSGSGSAQ